MPVSVVVGCPVWDRAWCLDAWFDCVVANTEPQDTGLVFCVPASDQASRNVISRRAVDFAFVEVLRDTMPNLGRRDRIRENHKTLATARNRIIQVVNEVEPSVFVSWDSDFFVPSGTVAKLNTKRAMPVQGVWAWLNRQAPSRVKWHGQTHLVDEPMAATAMEWDPIHSGRARHDPAGIWPKGFFLADLVLGFQVMTREAYRVGAYRPHPDDEHVPFFRVLSERGLPVGVHGEIVGVHIYEREGQVRWPQTMKLADERPLAVTRRNSDRSREQKTLGLFPLEA